MELTRGRLGEELAAHWSLPEVAALELEGQALDSDRALTGPEADLLKAP